MDDLGTILLAYAIVVGSIAAFSASIVRRGRRATRGLTEQEVPWT
jgi:hypothetical protein